MEWLNEMEMDLDKEIESLNLDEYVFEEDEEDFYWYSY